ncbi:hypothetical protein DERF_009660 [Dermatophagoides farinae]|uniref:Peptidase C1A papain C-terminal domain-containing protein n=1 Tax=Dermatophagoides farinae TaxID=6954 RepID=A0A922HWV3_DERFA|nr:hypothetical protein DERF_009660 [Dermatophagoides farinae]
MNWTLIKILLIVFAFLNLQNNDSFVNAKNGNSTKDEPTDHIITRLPAGFKILKKVIHGIRMKLLDTVVDLIHDIGNKTDLNKLEKCYSSEFGDRQLNLFQMPLHDVIYDYFTSGDHDHLFLSDSKFEIRQRLIIFVQNVKTLLHLIQKCLIAPYEEQMVMGITTLSHLSDHEYKQMLNKELYNKPLKLDNNNAQHKNITSSTSCIDPGPMVIPDEFDWNEKGKVTPIKQQFICGSCFIFSAVAVVESAYLIHGKTNLKPEEIDISEQAILDCMNPDVCRTGGWPTQAWMTMAHQGIVDEEDAPYMSMYTGGCKAYPKSKINYRIVNWCDDVYNTDDFIQRFILKHGPVFAAVDASGKEWKHNKGVFRAQCGKKLSHAIVITGWTKQYWIIKNSWGLNWGINGYLYLPRGQNKCGINSVIGVPFGMITP